MRKLYGVITALCIILFCFNQPVRVYASSLSTTTIQLIEDTFSKITASEIQDVNIKLNPTITKTQSDVTSYMNSRIKDAQVNISSFSYSEYIRANSDINLYCTNLRNSTAAALKNQKKKDRDAILSDLDNIIAAQKSKMQQDLFKTLLPYFMLPLS